MDDLRQQPVRQHRRTRRWRLAAWVAVALLLAAFASPLQTRYPVDDGLFYISTLHSLYADGDVDLRDDAESHPWLRLYSEERPLPSGRLRNPFPVGPSLLWAPFYAALDALERSAGLSGIAAAGEPRFRPAYFGTVFWIVLGLFVLGDTLRQLGVSRWPRRVSVAVVLLATALPALVSYAPAMGHGCSFAAVSFLLWTSVWCGRKAAVDSGRWALCGLALGVTFSVRWQDALLGVVPLTLWALSRRPGGPSPTLAERARGLGWLALGTLVGVAPQLLYWKALYGKWLLMPQGGGFLGPAHAEPLAFLFSTWNGVFLSHPVLLICLAGFAVPMSSGHATNAVSLRGLRLAALVAVGLEFAVSMLVVDWWAGGSFGQRRLISLLPLLALGLAALLESVRTRSSARLRRLLVAALALLAAWNLLSLARLHDGSLPYNPADPNWYPSGQAYGRYDFGRRFSDILFGAGRE